jgi:hypothetical protein
VCEGACDVRALLAAGCTRVVATFGAQGWRWDWAREVRALVLALDVAAAGQQQWRQLARQAARRGHKDASAAGAAGVLAVGDGPDGRAIPQDLQELWQERTAIMGYDGKLPPTEAARLAWAGLPLPREVR